MPEPQAPVIPGLTLPQEDITARLREMLQPQAAPQVQSPQGPEPPDEFEMEVKKRLLKKPEDYHREAQEELMERYFGVARGAKPNKKQKFLSVATDILSMLGGQAPMTARVGQRAKELAEHDQSRLSSAVAELRNQTAQKAIDERQRQFDAKQDAMMKEIERKALNDMMKAVIAGDKNAIARIQADTARFSAMMGRGLSPTMQQLLMLQRTAPEEHDKLLAQMAQVEGLKKTPEAFASDSDRQNMFGAQAWQAATKAVLGGRPTMSTGTRYMPDAQGRAVPMPTQTFTQPMINPRAMEIFQGGLQGQGQGTQFQIPRTPSTSLSPQVMPGLTPSTPQAPQGAPPVSSSPRRPEVFATQTGADTFRQQQDFGRAFHEAAAGAAKMYETGALDKFIGKWNNIGQYAATMFFGKEDWNPQEVARAANETFTAQDEQFLDYFKQQAQVKEITSDSGKAFSIPELKMALATMPKKFQSPESFALNMISRDLYVRAAMWKKGLADKLGISQFDAAQRIMAVDTSDILREHARKLMEKLKKRRALKGASEGLTPNDFNLDRILKNRLKEHFPELSGKIDKVFVDIGKVDTGTPMTPEEKALSDALGGVRVRRVQKAK